MIKETFSGFRDLSSWVSRTYWRCSWNVLTLIILPCTEIKLNDRYVFHVNNVCRTQRRRDFQKVGKHQLISWWLLDTFRMAFPEILNLNGLIGDGEQEIIGKEKPNESNSEEGIVINRNRHRYIANCCRCFHKICSFFLYNAMFFRLTRVYSSSSFMFEYYWVQNVKYHQSEINRIVSE